MRYFRVHLIGVSGAGMAPLAGLLREAGYRVSGSDVAFHPPMGPLLADWGVITHQGNDPTVLDALDPSCDVVVVGNVCRRDHPLVLAAAARGLRQISMPQALRELVIADSGRPVVAVAGTHGKTTTTALLAYILSRGGLEPGHLVGGVPAQLPPFSLGRTVRSLPVVEAQASQLGRAPAPFVIEGDEYDSAYFEKVPKVWGYAPEAVLLTSIEHDHVDIYPDLSRYLDAFRGLLERLPAESEGGLLVANVGDPAVAEVVRTSSPRCRVVTYAAADVAGRVFPGGGASAAHDEPAIWTAAQVPPADEDDLPRMDVFVGPTAVGRFALGLHGVHNVSNALGAVALAVEKFGLGTRETCASVSSFTGVARRMHRLVDGATSSRQVTFYDDFAHHPTAVAATLRALRSRHPRRRLIALYEPRSATACRRIHQEAYVEAFDPADVVWLAPVGRPELPADERLDVDRLVADLRARGKAQSALVPSESLVDHVVAELRPGDVLVAMSNGAFGGVVGRLSELLR